MALLLVGVKEYSCKNFFLPFCEELSPEGRRASCQILEV